MRHRPHAHDGEHRAKDRGTVDLPMFSGQPATEPAPAKTIDQVFAEFHAANPHIYAQLEAMALRLHANGRERVGIGALVEALRYDYQTRTSGQDFKVNNNFRSRYARLLVETRPELRGVIELRELRSA